MGKYPRAGGTFVVLPSILAATENETKMKEITTEIPDPIWQVFYFLASPESKYRYIPREWYEPIVTVKREGLRAHPDSRIDSFCKLECGEGMYIGKYVHIASFCHLGVGGGLLILEQGSSCASGVKIVTGSNQPGEGYGCSAIDPKAVIKRSFVHVKRNATLYTNVVVCPGVTVGAGAVVLPGAVVTRDVPDGETWGGVPAKKITMKGSDKSKCQHPIFDTKDFAIGKCLYCGLPGHMDSSGNVIYQSQTEIEHIPVKTPGMDSGEVVPIDHTKDIIDRIEREEGKLNFLPDHTPDRWVESQAEMYGWDDKEPRNIG